jgi:FtsP/CotA-like multicopper oxidase with cupredoxin domain
MASPARAQVGGCELLPRPSDPTYATKFATLLAQHGLRPFENPKEVRPTSPSTPYVLRVQAGKNTVAGCPVTLRSYNGGLVGHTIRAKPGDTLYIKLINELVAGELEATPPQHPQGPELDANFSFNITNLHTHGLHVSPSGDSDNVFIELKPRTTAADPPAEQLYKIVIPDDHPAGTFWYHAHVHGSTAVQLASGMAGALIIEGGTARNGDLDVVPEIAAARSTEKIFVLQQFAHDTNGEIKIFNEAMMSRRRPTMINGQLVPEIKLRPGEVQRWRFIHAGMIDNVSLALDGHPLHEVATDGNSLGRIASWPAAAEAGAPNNPILILGPGYRTDLLVQAQPLAAGETRKEYYLRDLRLPPRLSIQAGEALIAQARQHFRPMANAAVLPVIDKPEQVLARIVVEGPTVAMNLPSPQTLATVKPVELTDIVDAELTVTPPPKAHFAIGPYHCDALGQCVRCNESEDCPFRFVVNDQIFMHMHSHQTHGNDDGDATTIKQPLGGAAEWELSGEVMAHPFHIHVNPFQMSRDEFDATGQTVSARVWKDTVLVMEGNAGRMKVRTRYTRFEGKFVLHCHILTHEDRGMMQAVEIVAQP